MRPTSITYLDPLRSPGPGPVTGRTATVENPLKSQEGSPLGHEGLLPTGLE